MSEAGFDALGIRIVWLAFALAIGLGILMRSVNFCTMGAIADVHTMRDWHRMRIWLCAIGFAVIGTQGLAATGLIDLSDTIYTGTRLTWFSHLLGGFMFGFGMVLASGCTGKTLLRIGAGSLKSLVVFLVIGISAYIAMRGLIGVIRVNLLDTVSVQLGAAQDIPSLLAADAGTRMLIALSAALPPILFALAHPAFRRPAPVLASAGIGLAVVALWFISGNLGHVSENPYTLEEVFVRTNSGRSESFTFVAPMAFTLELLMFWSDSSRVVTIGIAIALGVCLGAFMHAQFSREFRWEGFVDVEDMANHLCGAVLMGTGGVIALGCTFGQGLSGISTLSLGSMIAWLAILAGGWVGVSYQGWRTDRRFARSGAGPN